MNIKSLWLSLQQNFIILSPSTCRLLSKFTCIYNALCSLRSGMEKLREFTNSVNNSLYSSDVGLHNLISYFQGDSQKAKLDEKLKKWEQNIPYWNALADEAARPEKLPRIEKYDSVGNPVERVVLPLETRIIRHRVVESGIFDNNSEFEKFSKVYLLAQIGESGVTCPLACTDGLIRVLEAKGSEYLKNKYLDQLKSSETPLAGAQFITEQSGGSDVGAIEGVARHDGEDNYRIYAQKWYCSTPEEFFLIVARVEGAEKGTKGLSIFLVPRIIPNGSQDGPDYIPNHLTIKRLKDKLGTQSLPTAEIDFDGSIAYMIGHETEGFSNLMNYVINCSRIHNSVAALGLMRRAFVEARNYAEQRVAFNTEIINHPLVGEHLVSILSHLTAKQAMFLDLMTQIDKNGWLPADKETNLWQRFLINMLKYRTSIQLTDKIKEAILVFGANGIVNDFSILPRLFRDAMILETWEGTHNTLCLQILRDVHKFNFFERINQEIENIISEWPHDVMKDSKKFYVNFYDIGIKVFNPTNMYDPHWVKTHARRFIDHYADLLETGNLVRIGVAQKNCNILIHASYLMHKLMSDRFSEFVSPTIDNLSGICLNLIREIPLDINIK